MDPFGRLLRALDRVEGVEIPVARLLHIVQSKHAANRDRDRLLLATHRDALATLLTTDANQTPKDQA